MLLHQDQQKVHKMLTEAITMLCRNGLDFSQDITVEGLLGITLDSKEVFLVNIKEKFSSSESSPKTQSSEVHTSTTTKEENTGAFGTSSDKPFPYTHRQSPGRHSCGSFFPGPLAPMVHDSPFRRQRGHRHMTGGLRWIRKRMNNPHFRMMHAMLASSQSVDADQPPFPKRQNLFTELPNFSPPKSKSSTIVTDPNLPDTSQQPLIKEEPSEDGDNESMIDHSDVSASESLWYGSQNDDLQSQPRTPSSVSTVDNLSETYEDVENMDINVIARVQRAIMKEEGCFVTVRMMCRRYSAFFKSHVVIDAMKHITKPVNDPQHIGVFRVLKERSSKVFYKCPPDRISAEALNMFNMTKEQYEQSYSCMPKPVGMHNPRWALYTDHVLSHNPYGIVNVKLVPEVRVDEEVSMEPGSTLDEFQLQGYIVLSSGCFVSSRILCRKLSKQYKVVNVIRAMKAMTRSRSDSNYIGQFVKVSERIKIFFKAPPQMVGHNAYKLYNMSEDEYKTLYFSSPRPWDGSLTNWDSYVENAMAHYPFPFENFPIECCHVSPDIMERIAYIGHGKTASSGSYASGSLTGFLGMLHEESTNSLARAHESDETVQRIQDIFGQEVIVDPVSEIDLPPAISIQDQDLGEV